MSSDRGKSLDSGLWPTREAWVVDINILSCTVRRLAGRVGTPVVAGCLEREGWIIHGISAADEDGQTRLSSIRSQYCHIPITINFIKYWTYWEITFLADRGPRDMQRKPSRDHRLLCRVCGMPLPMAHHLVRIIISVFIWEVSIVFSRSGYHWISVNECLNKQYV